MSRAAYGMLAGVIGSAIGYWLWSRGASVPSDDERGTVIYRNTPTASEGV